MNVSCLFFPSVALKHCSEEEEKKERKILKFFCQGLKCVSVVIPDVGHILIVSPQILTQPPL